MRMIANRHAAVAAAFSNSCKPTLPGESCWAAIPEPITIAARNADPMSSATRRRDRGAVTCARPLSLPDGMADACRPLCVIGPRGVAQVSQHLALLVTKTIAGPFGGKGEDVAADRNVVVVVKHSIGAAADDLWRTGLAELVDQPG